MVFKRSNFQDVGNRGLGATGKASSYRAKPIWTIINVLNSNENIDLFNILDIYALFTSDKFMFH